MAKKTMVVETGVYAASGRSVMSSLLIGAGVGLFGWLLTLAIDNWFLKVVFCRSADSTGACANADVTAWIIAQVIVGLIGLFALIRANIFRPLLVVLAALLTLWLAGLWFFPFVWWVGALWQTVLFALAYALFAWLASTERFVVALLATIVLVVVMRLIATL